MYNLANKKIWLTGASSGIGKALAFELAKRGAILALTSRNKEALDEVVRQIAGAGMKALAFPADVTSLEEMKNASLAIRKMLEGIDILLANAGTHLFSIPEQFDSAQYQSIMELNYNGLLHSIESVLPGMIEDKSGYIVGVASLVGYRGLPRAAAYGASKAAVINFLESIRFHLRQYNIPVTIINPGFVKTPLTDKNDFQMPFLVSAEQAAIIICDGMEKQKKEIVFPFPFNWILKLARIIPYPIYEFITDKIWKSMNSSKVKHKH